MPASSAMVLWVMEGEESRGSITFPNPLIHSHLHQSHPNMPTELPYAADAEDSLSYDELQVCILLLQVFIDSADTQSFRCFASSTRGRWRSPT